MGLRMTFPLPSLTTPGQYPRAFGKAHLDALLVAIQTADDALMHLLWKDLDLKADINEQLLPTLLRRDPNVDLTALIQAHPFLLGTSMDGKTLTMAAHAQRWDLVMLIADQWPRLIKASHVDGRPYVDSTNALYQAAKAHRFDVVARLWPLHSAPQQGRFVTTLLENGHAAEHATYAKLLLPHLSEEQREKHLKDWLWSAVENGNVAYLKRHQAELTSDRCMELLNERLSSSLFSTRSSRDPNEAHIDRAEPGIRFLVAQLDDEAWMTLAKTTQERQGRLITLPERMQTLARYASPAQRDIWLKHYGATKLNDLAEWHRAQHRREHLAQPAAVDAGAPPARRLRIRS